MRKADFSGDEITLAVDDAIRFHSCRDGPSSTGTSVPGKLLATADAPSASTNGFLSVHYVGSGPSKTFRQQKNGS